jgi:CRP-like cAMP-binding protein
MLALSMKFNQFTSSMDKVTALRKSEVFRVLPEDLLRKIAALAISRQLSRGQVLFSEHDEASGVYVVVSGEFRSIRQSADGREQVLSTERAGATLAAVAVFNDGKFYSTMIADASAEVICVNKRDMYQLCREHPEILWRIAKLLADTVRRHAELIETLVFRNVEERLAQHLLTIARQRGVTVGDGCAFEMTLTRTEVASRLGSVREVVSRAFTHLQENGLIRLDGQRLVTIPDMRALQQFAGTEHALPDAKLASKISSELA